MSELISQLNGGATSGQDPVAITSEASIVVGPVDIQEYARFTVYVQNVGGGLGDAINSVLLQTSPEDDDLLWTDVAELLGAPLASGLVAYEALSNQSLKYIRIQASCAEGENTTARFWVSAGGHP